MRHNSGHPTNTHAAGRRKFIRGSLLSLRLPKPRERRFALYRHQFAWRGALWANLHNRLYIPPRVGVGALVSGASGRGFGLALRGFVFALLRPRPRRLRLLWLRFCVWCWPRSSRDCGDFVLLFIYTFCVGPYRGCGGFASAFLVRRLVFLRAVVSCLRLVI